MPGEHPQLKAWAVTARQILGVVRGSPQVSAVSRKALRGIRQAYDAVAVDLALLADFEDAWTGGGEASGFEATYGELVKALQGASGGQATEQLGQRMQALRREVKAALDRARPEAARLLAQSQARLRHRLDAVDERARQMKADVDLTQDRRNLDTAREQLDRGDPEEAQRTLGLVAHSCDLATRQMDVMATRARFTDVPSGESVGRGQWAVKSLMDYAPSGPLDVPGTSFDDVCPGQDHVNKAIVEKKIQAGLPGKPVIPAAISPDGKICLLDKHHTFVACMALGRPVQLALTAMPTFNGKSDWTQCTWEKFTPKAVAAGGFSLTQEESARVEGPREQNPDWKAVVPWRKDGKELDASDRPATPEETGQTLQRSQEGTDLLDPEVAQGFQKQLEAALSVGPVHEHFARLCGGDGFKIKFDPKASNAYFDGTRIVLPTTQAKGGKPRSPQDLLDALVFESCNIEMKDQFKAFDNQFDREGGALSDYGVDKAGLEASLTVLRSARMVHQMKSKGIEVAEQGLRNIEAIERLDPGFFEAMALARPPREGSTGEGEDGAPNEEAQHREAALIRQLKDLVSATRHQAGLDPDRPEDLPNPQWLKSGEMYHYEKVRDMGPLALNTLILKQVTAVAPENWENKPAFQDWLGKQSGLYTAEKERQRRPLLFCKLLNRIKSLFPAVDFSGMAFNSDMIRCAEANGAGVADVPAPPPLVLREVADSGSYEAQERRLHEQLKVLRRALDDYQPQDRPAQMQKVRLEDVWRKAPLRVDDDGDVESVLRDVEKALQTLAAA